ncbi:hypothetical protein NXC24_PC00232 (plasmid) [Rhizobium sp. NXC24]|nr:hypothetical protein NXC24_PC00232 [Rhizobium sp. NXC24]
MQSASFDPPNGMSMSAFLKESLDLLGCGIHLDFFLHRLRFIITEELKSFRLD